MKDKFWVVDTNTLMSALLMENSTPGLALKKARKTGTLIISPEISAEYFDVFCRAKFEEYLSLETRMAFIENIITNALTIEINEVITACRDPKDNMFLSLAVSAGVDAILSGDKALLLLHPFRNIPVLSSAEFLKKI